MTPKFLVTLAGILLLTLGGGFVARSLARSPAGRRKGGEMGIAFAAGFLVSIFLGEVAHEAGAATGGAAAFVLGFGATFLLQARTHFHLCPMAADACPSASHGYEGWLPGFALIVHNALDGVVLASADAVRAPVALSVALAIGIHKVFDGFALGLLLERAGVRSGASFAARLLAFACTTPAFAVATASGLALDPGLHSAAPILLGLSGGAFLFFALEEVIPRARVHGGETVERLGRTGFLLALGSGLLLGFARVLTADRVGW